METLLQNKRFINVSIVLVVLLSLFTFAKFMNEVKSSEYIGHGNQAPNVISVSGVGEVKAVSDIATISVNISKDGTTAKEAQNALNIGITKVVGYLKDQKIEEKDIKSEYGGINPKYSNSQNVCFNYPCPQFEQKIVGYTSNQSITVKVRSVDSANDIRTGLSSLGVTDINGPTFTIDDEDIYKDQARSKAIDEAKKKADKLARELGVRLGKVVNFSENSNGGPIMYDAKVSMESVRGQAAPAPVLPKGENKITSNVTISYEIY